MIEFPAETLELLQIVAAAVGIALTLAVFAVGVSEIAAKFIHTHLP